MLLFFKLLPLHTRGDKTNWQEMARAYNAEVVRTLQQPHDPQLRAQVTIKTDKQLRKFDRDLVKELCWREGMAFSNSLAGQWRSYAPLTHGLNLRAFADLPLCRCPKLQ